jgi:hypothetical protein
MLIWSRHTWSYATVRSLSFLCSTDAHACTHTYWSTVEKHGVPCISQENKNMSTNRMHGSALGIIKCRWVKREKLCKRNMHGERHVYAHGYMLQNAHVCENDDVLLCMGERRRLTTFSPEWHQSSNGIGHESSTCAWRKSINYALLAKPGTSAKSGFGPQCMNFLGIPGTVFWPCIPRVFFRIKSHDGRKSSRTSFSDPHDWKTQTQNDRQTDILFLSPGSLRRSSSCATGPKRAGVGLDLVLLQGISHLDFSRNPNHRLSKWLRRRRISAWRRGRKTMRDSSRHLAANASIRAGKSRLFFLFKMPVKLSWQEVPVWLWTRLAWVHGCALLIFGYPMFSYTVNFP